MYEKNQHIIFWIVFVLACGLIIFLTGPRRENDTGSGVNPQTIADGIQSAGANINSAREKQRDAAAGIERAEARVENIEGQVNSSGILIRRCRESVGKNQQILRSLLEGTESPNQGPARPTESVQETK